MWIVGPWSNFLKVLKNVSPNPLECSMSWIWVWESDGDSHLLYSALQTSFWNAGEESICQLFKFAQNKWNVGQQHASVGEFVLVYKDGWNFRHGRLEESNLSCLDKMDVSELNWCLYLSYSKTVSPRGNFQLKYLGSFKRGIMLL